MGSAPFGLLLFGIGLYGLFWFRPDNIGIPNPPHVGAWKSPPTTVRRLFRKGSGSVRIAALLWQVSALAMIAVALFWLTGLLSTLLGALVAWIAMLAIVVASIGSGLLLLMDLRPDRQP
jgi:hypothetical protein